MNVKVAIQVLVGQDVRDDAIEAVVDIGLLFDDVWVEGILEVDVQDTSMMMMVMMRMEIPLEKRMLRL